MTYTSFRRGLILSATLLCSSVQAADEASGCKYFPIAELPLSYTGPALQITTEGAIDGVAGPMLVDTGASFSSLTRTATERRGLGLGTSGSYAVGVGGVSRLYQLRVREFAVGPVKTRGFMSVIGDTGSPPAFDAIIGASFLLQTDVELQLAEKKMRFLRSQGCDADSFLGYWDGDIFVIPFERQDNKSSNPHFIVEVNGAKIEAIIDTGAVNTVMSSRGARKAGLGFGAAGDVKLGNASGVGRDRAPVWGAKARLKIGGETVENAEIGIIDDDSRESGYDLVLGDDFLRAHRVLFAMSQKKLYISYVGGEPFKHHTSLEPWLVREAEGGNPDAQLRLASIYRNGYGTAKDPKLAEAWLQKAIAAGSPHAKLELGHRLMSEGRYGEAAVQLRDALDKLPAERTGALWLYTARLQSGQADLGKQELEAAFARGNVDDWPRPVADFYLGRIDQAKLLKLAADDERLAKQRTCSATSYVTELYRARGEQQQADAAHASWRAQCAPPKQTASANQKGDIQ